MKMLPHNKNFLTGLLSLAGIFLSLISTAQQIHYSEVERDDSRRTNFEIIGKVGGNILVFKNNRADNDISVYDMDMKLKERVNLDYMDDQYINVDFIPYSDYCWMIYQYQRKGVVYCMGVKLNSDAKHMTEPVQLDTTHIGWAASNKIYTTIYSEDKSKIMVFKINNRNPKNFVFTTLLYTGEMSLLNRHVMNLAMEERNDYFTDFKLDNEGNLVFGKFIRKNNSDYTTGIDLILKPASAGVFNIHPLNIQDRILDDIMLRIDNSTKRYLVSSFYYAKKRGAIEGLYSVVWNVGVDSASIESFMPFGDDLRAEAKGTDANQKYAFDDYFIKDVITRKDSGYVLIAEILYNTSRGGSAFNRWDYYNWNNPWASPLNYYWSPYYSPWRYPYNGLSNSPNTRYNAENIMILSFRKDNTVEWSNVIPKSQYDDEGDELLSYALMNTGGQLHFLFNQYERRTLLLNDQSIGADGKITRYPTLKNLDRGYEFMPRYGKQISSRSIVMPCRYRNYLCFAKIDF